MRFAMFQKGSVRGIAVEQDGSWYGRMEGAPGYPGDLDTLLAIRADLEGVGNDLIAGDEVDLTAVKLLPPLEQPGKIICVGLNYKAHSAEVGIELPTYPTIFARFTSSLIGHGDAIVRPKASSQLDFEGELVAIIGKGGREIPVAHALEHVAGYSIFNDATLRDFQFRTPQWTVGKNFDGTGAFGPYFTTPYEVPGGCKGLRLQTRLNGTVVQDTEIDDMVFDVATLVSVLSEGMTLEPGDIIVTGTPSGIGMSRKPPLWMKPGDVVEVEIDSLGILRNEVVMEL